MNIDYTLNINDLDIEVNIEYDLEITRGVINMAPEDCYPPEIDFEITGWETDQELPVEIDDLAIERAIEDAEEDIFESVMAQH